jgi:hypothetical protein
MTEPVVIDRRFRGPPASANGGYTCGLVAVALGAKTAEVNLRAPPPLEKELALERATEVRLFDPEDGTLLADGRRIDDFELELPDSPPLEVALEADRRYPYYDDHAFPGCFVCGPDRDEGDGLCIYPGPIGDGSLLTCAWTPAPAFAGADGSLRDEVAWAALDCPSGNAAHHHDPGEGLMVLARLRGRLELPIAVGKPYVVAGWTIDLDGRKHRSATAIYDHSGEPSAWAEALWIELS